MNKTDKFTLIELLVVIAIIGILVSILAPSLSKAKLKAQMAVCASNQKQLGMAVSMFSTENKGVLPNLSGLYNENGSLINWRIELAPYLGIEVKGYPFDEIANGVFECPSSKLESTIDLFENGICYNLKLGSRKIKGGDGNWNPNSGSTVILDEIEAPTETAVTGDSCEVDNPKYINHILLSPSRFGDFAVGDRHFKGINILWADLHVAWIAKTTLIAGKDGDRDYYYQPIKK